MAEAPRDQNFVTSVLLESSTNPGTVFTAKGDEITGRMFVDIPSGSGTVTSVSVVTANGISGSVADPTTTPAITLTLGAITPSAVQVSGLTASEIVITDGSKNLVSAAVATYPSLTELTYLKGVTSSIQTQINAKGSGTVTAVSIATANGFSGSSSGGATPALTIVAGAITPTTVNGLTISTTTGTFTLTNGKTFAVTHGLTLSGTDSTVMTFPTTSATIARTDAGQTFTGTQVIGALTVTTINGNTFTTGTGVLTIAASKTATHNATTTFAGTDGKTLTISNSGTLGGGDAFVLAIAAAKTFTVSNTLTLAGTDATVMTFPTTSATIARTDAGQTFTGVQTFSTPIATGSVATMTATVGGGVPTPPNNTTTFLRGDGTFAAPVSSAGLVRVGGDATEDSTASTSSTDLTVISGLSIPAGTRVRITGKGRKIGSGAFDCGLGLKINSTDVVTSAPGGNDIMYFSSNAAEFDGIFIIELEVGETGYTSALIRTATSSDTSNRQLNWGNSTSGLVNTAVMPSATITSITITGRVANAAISVACKNVQVYTYANA